MSKVVVLHPSEMYLITLTILTTHLQLRLARHNARLLGSSLRTATSCASLLLLLLLCKLFLELSLVDGSPETWGVGDSWWLIRNFMGDLDILSSLLCEDLCELINISCCICQCTQLKPKILMFIIWDLDLCCF